jgi:hypothetical protein
MYFRQLNKIESAIESKEDKIPAMHSILIQSDKTKQQALFEYKDKNHTEPGDHYFYILVYPAYANYRHTSFVKNNEQLIDKLLNEGFTLDQIFQKYLNDNATKEIQ